MAQELNQNQIRTLFKEVLKYGKAALTSCTAVHKIQLSKHVNAEIQYFVNGAEQMVEYAKNNYSWYSQYTHTPEHYSNMFHNFHEARKVKQILENSTGNQPPQKKEKQMPKLNEALILFDSPETIEKLYDVLKGYFKGDEAKFKMTLKGERLNSRLLFPSNQNKFVDVFLRLKFNGFLLSKPKEINGWLCSNFAFQFHKGDVKEVRKFNSSTVNDILTKDKGLPSKGERIKIDWLPNKNINIL